MRFKQRGERLIAIASNAAISAFVMPLQGCSVTSVLMFGCVECGFAVCLSRCEKYSVRKGEFQTKSILSKRLNVESRIALAIQIVSRSEMPSLSRRGRSVVGVEHRPQFGAAIMFGFGEIIWHLWMAIDSTMRIDR